MTPESRAVVIAARQKFDAESRARRKIRNKQHRMTAPCISKPPRRHRDPAKPPGRWNPYSESEETAFCETVLAAIHELQAAGVNPSILNLMTHLHTQAKNRVYRARLILRKSGQWKPRPRKRKVKPPPKVDRHEQEQAEIQQRIEEIKASKAFVDRQAFLAEVARRRESVVEVPRVRVLKGRHFGRGV